MLQVRILIQLSEERAKTITDLADRVQAKRPSVSRALRTLREQGLVVRDRFGWELTEAGEKEARRSEERLQKTALQASESIARSIKALHASPAMAASMEVISASLPWINDAIQDVANGPAKRMAKTQLGMISDMAEMMRPPVFPDLSASAQALESINGRVHDLDTMNFSVGRDLAAASRALGRVAGEFPDFRALNSAISQVLEAQHINTRLLQDITGVASSSVLEHAARTNNLLVSHAVEDLIEIRSAIWDSQQEAMIDVVDISGMTKSLRNITHAYSRVFEATAVQALNLPKARSENTSVSQRLILSTGAVANYTLAARQLVSEEHQHDYVLYFLMDQLQSEAEEELDRMLHEIDPMFVEMRHGAWIALQRRDPDYLRHAGTSQRELIRQLLEHLVPADRLPKGQRQGAQIRARVRMLLQNSESDAEFVDAMAAAVIAYYLQLNKYTHHNERHEASLRAVLRAGEATLHFLLLNVDSRVSQ